MCIPNSSFFVDPPEGPKKSRKKITIGKWLRMLTGIQLISYAQLSPSTNN